jgi:hypothetical protein
MDALDRIKADALAAREFTQTAGECVLTLRAPTRREVRECAHQRRLLSNDADALVLPLLKHYLLERAIVGWQGVRVRDLVPGSADAAPVPWSADAASLYLDANPEHADEMGTELLARVRVRGDQIEDDAKN